MKSTSRQSSHEAACPVTKQVHHDGLKVRSLDRVHFSTDADHPDVANDFRTELHRSTRGLEVNESRRFLSVRFRPDSPKKVSLAVGRGQPSEE